MHTGITIDDVDGTVTKTFANGGIQVVSIYDSKTKILSDSEVEKQVSILIDEFSQAVKSTRKNA